MCAFIQACLQLSSGYVSLLQAALRTERTLLVHRGSHCPADSLSLPAVPEHDKKNITRVMPYAGAGP